MKSQSPSYVENEIINLLIDWTKAVDYISCT